MRVAVVGHVEWIDFVRVERLPRSGEIIHALAAWAEPGGGGAVAAVQLRKLAGEATFFTALGDDELGRRALAELRAHGLTVEAVFRPEPQRRGLTFVEPSGERTITVVGDRMAPRRSDPLPWDDLKSYDAVYLTAGDAAAVQAARAARVLVATPRGLEAIAGTRVELDALVGSAIDPGERYRDGDLAPPPRLLVQTAGARGGTFRSAGGPPDAYVAAPVPGPIADAYGCGDSFAAALTFALGRGDAPVAALELAARCGAACLTGRGPYAGQLELAS